MTFCIIFQIKMQICNWSENTFFLEKCNEIASCFTDINESKQIIIDLNKCKFGSVSEFLPYICLKFEGMCKFWKWPSRSLDRENCEVKPRNPGIIPLKHSVHLLLQSKWCFAILPRSFLGFTTYLSRFSRAKDCWGPLWKFQQNNHSWVLILHLESR